MSRAMFQKQPDVFTFHIILWPGLFIGMLTLPNSMPDFGPQEKPLFTDPLNQLQDHTSKFLLSIIALHIQSDQLAAFHNHAQRFLCRTTGCFADLFKSNTSEKLISISVSSSSPSPPPPPHVMALPSGKLQYALQKHEM